MVQFDIDFTKEGDFFFFKVWSFVMHHKEFAFEGRCVVFALHTRPLAYDRAFVLLPGCL